MNNERNSNIIRTALIVSRIIIWIWIRRVFFRENTLETQDTTEIIAAEEDTRYYIDESVLLDWTIARATWFAMYTHDFVDTDWTLFWLKSADIDLYKYNGEVSIKGDVVDIIDNKALIKVSEIVSQQWDTDWNNLVANPSFSYFKNAWIWLDLSISQWYEVEQQGGEIVLIDTKSWWQIETILSIAPFQCTTWDSLRDCATLKKTFYDLNSETFTSDNNITFYNLTETNTWLMFDTKDRGFYVKPRNKDDLINFVDMIIFLDNETIKDKLETETNSSCKTLEHTLWKDKNIILTAQNDWLISWNITWPSANDVNTLITCTYIIKPGALLEFQLLSIVTWDASWFELVPFEWTPRIKEGSLPVDAQKEKEDETSKQNNNEEDNIGTWTDIVPPATWEDLSNTEALKDAIDQLVADTQENLWEGWEPQVPSEPIDPSFIDAPQEKPQDINWWSDLTFEQIQQIERGENPTPNTEEQNKVDNKDNQNNSDQEEEPIEPENPTPQNSRYDWRLWFESVRWYTTFFWDNKIAYAGGYIQEDKKITVDGADCWYWVHIINRSNTSKVLETPDSIIYECTWTPNKASLPNEITYITEHKGKHFIKKDFTNAFAWMEVGIE